MSPRKKSQQPKKRKKKPTEEKPEELKQAKEEAKAEEPEERLEQTSEERTAETEEARGADEAKAAAEEGPGAEAGAKAAAEEAGAKGTAEEDEAGGTAEEETEEPLRFEHHKVPNADHPSGDAPWVEGEPEHAEPPLVADEIVPFRPLQKADESKKPQSGNENEPKKPQSGNKPEKAEPGNKPEKAETKNEPETVGLDIVTQAKTEAAEEEALEELESIYESNDDEEDMSRLDRGASQRWRRLLIGLVVFFGFLAIVSWIGFFLFSPSGKKFTGDGVKVEIQGPPQVMSGQQVTYSIVVNNNESVPLGTANLELRLPKQFVVSQTEPAANDNDAWQIGSLAPNRSKTYKLTGIFLAPLESQLDLQAILNYRPADFNSLFQKVATRTIGVSDSVFDVSVDGPERILPGDNVVLTVEYENTTDNEFTDLKLRATWPEGFIPESADPAALNEDYSAWAIESLAANASGEIKVTGSFASDAKGKNEIKLEFGLVMDQGAFGLQETVDYSVNVIEGELVLSLVLNGKSQDQPVSFGDTLHYSLSWKNTGDSNLEDVALTAVIDAEPLATVVDWNRLEDLEEGERQDNRLTWTGKQVTSLETVRPDDEGTIDFDLPIVNGPLAETDDTDYLVSAWVEAMIDSIDGQTVSRQVKTPQLTAIVSSDTAFSAAARYFSEDGLPIGSGPLPPTVGQATTYRVQWQVTNSLHELSDLKISARLPDNVIYTGQSTLDAGELTFDAANSKMVWSLNWLPTNVKSLSVSFDVAITPTTDQQGKTPTVVDAAIMECRDKANGNPIILAAPPLTTALPDDSFARGKGEVQ